MTDKADKTIVSFLLDETGSMDAVDQRALNLDRGGKWKLIRVIEEASIIEEPAAAETQEREGNDG